MLRSFSTYLAATLVGFLLVTLVAFVGCGPQDESGQTNPVGQTWRNVSGDVGYVGKGVCQSCHPDKFATFTEAQMGRSFKPALLKHSAADFEDVDPVYDPAFDLYYQAFHRGEDLYIMEYRLADGDTVHKRIEKIDYIVGSGQHTNSHIMEVNGYLYQMPMTWYAQDGKWDLAPKFSGGNNRRFSRPITETCMTCHNAMPGFVEGSENKFSNVPDGIDCERCHGPGELHVEEKRAGKMVDVRTEIDYSIVNPGKLPLDLQFDVCQRCHMQGATVYAEGKGPRDFRPGMKLESVLNVFQPRFADSTEKFIMASHPDRLQMSECFLGSHEENSGFEPMTCTTCHDPHVSIETLGSDHYRSVCQSCHTPLEGVDLAAANPRTSRNDEAEASKPQFVKTREHPAASRRSAGVCTEDLAVRKEVDDNCVQCHMPVSGSTDIPHVRVTDHYIRAVEDRASIVEVSEDGFDAEGRFVGLASLIDQDPTEREMAEGYMTLYEESTNRPLYLDSAAVHLERARREESDEELASSLVRLYHLQRDFDATVRLSRKLGREAFSDAWTLYRIGEAYSNIGDLPTAILYMEEAVSLSPDHPRFLNQLGSTYTEARRIDEALEVFNRLLEANPKYAEAHNNRGFARIFRREFDQAEDDFLKAIALDPDAEQAIANLASLYLNTGRAAEARPYARRLLDLAPDNANYQRLWDLVK